MHDDISAAPDLAAEMEGTQMLYAILCYHDETVTSKWTAEHDAQVIGQLQQVRANWPGQFGPVARLQPTSTAATLRGTNDLVLDGPFAETKEQLLGFYVVDIHDQNQGRQILRDLSQANPGATYELCPIMKFFPGDTASTDDTSP